MTSWRCRCSAVSSCPLGALVTPRPSHPHPCPAPAASPWLRPQGGPAQGTTNGTRVPDSDRLGEPLCPPSGCCLWVGRSGFRASLWGCQGPAGPGPLVRLWEGSTGLPGQLARDMTLRSLWNEWCGRQSVSSCGSWGHPRPGWW